MTWIIVGIFAVVVVFGIVLDFLKRHRYDGQ